MWSSFLTGGLLDRLQSRRAMREFDELDKADARAMALQAAAALVSVKSALDAKDRTTATKLWNETLARYPRAADVCDDAVDILLDFERFEEAEALAQEKHRRAPRVRDYAGSYALVAERRGDTQEAIRRWAAVRKKFPTYFPGYLHSAMCLRAAGKNAEAEALLKKATTIFPREWRGWIEWARTAEHRGDWPEAMRRWDTVSKTFQHHAGDLGIAQGLVELGKLDEAEKHLKESRTRFPLVPEIVFELAKLEYRRGNKEEAARHWAEARRRFPRTGLGYSAGAQLLSEMGRPGDAEDVLLAAIRQLPEAAWPAVEYALLATRRKDWPAALDRWASVRERWPNRQDGYMRAAEALAALGRRAEGDALIAEYRSRAAA